MTVPRLVEPRQWWPSLDRASILIALVCVVVGCGAVYASSVLSNRIEEAFTQKAAAGTVLSVDSFVEPLVQELAASPSLSAEHRQALERLLSPAALGKPITAFEIWRDNRRVFSLGQMASGLDQARAQLADRASRGEVAAHLVLDDEEMRGEPLSAPILEIYAPIRQTGSNRIIALAAFSELAGELTRKIRAAQYASYVLIASAATTLLIVLFNLTGGLQRRIGELSLQQAADELIRRKVCRANGRVFEMNEQNLRRLGQVLHAGPLQLTALALLKVDALLEPPVAVANSERANDVEAIRHALRECQKQIRELSAELLPSEWDGLSFTEAIRTAVCLHELRTATPVACDFRDLPQSAPNALKACAYQFVSQGLTSAFQHSDGGNVELRASGREKLEIELSYDVQRSKALSWLAQDLEDGNVRHRIEALGGSLLVRSEAERRLRITAEFGALGAASPM